jgi:hypothetical protein
MTSTNLIIGDLMFVFVLVMIYETGGLKQNMFILGPLIIIAFATCVVRHINYYKMTKRIY